MRILHITASHLNPVGGIPVVLKELVPKQNMIDGCIARVLSLKASVSAMDLEYFDNLTNTDIKDYLLEFKPDAVVFHGHFYLEYISIAKHLRKMNIIYFIEPHGSFVKAALKKSKLKKFVANHTIFYTLIKGAYGFIYLNELEKKKSVYHTKNDQIIPNGININELKKEIISYDGEPLIYFIGRYDIEDKALDILLDALKIIDSNGYKLHFNFYGKGNHREENYIKKRIGKFKSIIVKENGAIYKDSKNEALEQRGIMILTSRHEGFPMTVLEAWAYGNPCIVTPGTNVMEYVAENQLGWGCQLTKESIAQTILKAVDDYTVNSADYKKQCKLCAANDFSWENIAKLYVNRISEAIHKK